MQLPVCHQGPSTNNIPKDSARVTVTDWGLLHTIYKAGMLFTVGGVKLKAYHIEEIKTGQTLQKLSEYIMCASYAYMGRDG